MRRCLTSVAMVAALLSLLAGVAAARPLRVPVVKAGYPLVFAPRAISRGGLVYCSSHGIRAAGHVPARGHTAVVIADGVRGRSATLRLTARKDGSFIATCR